MTSGLTWTVKPEAGDSVLTKDDAGVVTAELPPGTYRVSVVRAADGLEGKASLNAVAGAERTVTVALEFPLEASLALTPPGEAPAGSKVSVAWQGPNRDGDYVTVVRQGAAAHEYLDYEMTARGNPLDIVVPVEPGAYEMRYVLGRPQRVLASEPLNVAAVEAALTVPTTAIAGSTIDVAWTGPGNPGDWITVVEPDDAAAAYNGYFDAKPDNRALTLPVEPGDYEVRYVQGGQKVIARAPIAVTPATAEIRAPQSVAAGGELETGWTGPSNRGDWLTIVRPEQGETEYGSYADADRGNPAKLRAPVDEGGYELRYVLQGRKIIARRAIAVTPVTAAITAPESVAADAEFDIGWTGPNNNGDWLTIVRPEQGETEYGSYADADRDSPARLEAPAVAGTYELRYVLQGKKVIARRAIAVVQP